MSEDLSLESAVHRWVARLEAEHIEVVRADATIARVRRHTTVALELTLATVSPRVQMSHDDPYVAVADTFRAARRQLLAGARLVATG